MAVAVEVEVHTSDMHTCSVWAVLCVHRGARCCRPLGAGVLGGKMMLQCIFYAASYWLHCRMCPHSPSRPLTLSPSHPFILSFSHYHTVGSESCAH